MRLWGKTFAGETILCDQRMVSPAPRSKKVILDFCERYLSRLCPSEAKPHIPKPDCGTKNKNCAGKNYFLPCS